MVGPVLAVVAAVVGAAVVAVVAAVVAAVAVVAVSVVVVAAGLLVDAVEAAVDAAVAVVDGAADVGLLPVGSVCFFVQATIVKIRNRQSVRTQILRIETPPVISNRESLCLLYPFFTIHRTCSASPDHVILN
jgi:hypothetical protein